MRPQTLRGVCCEAIRTLFPLSRSHRTASSSCLALATRRSEYKMRLQALSGVCYEAIRATSMPSRSLRTASSSCQALATRLSRYGMRPQRPSGVCYETKKPLYSFSPFPLVVNVSLLFREPYGYLTPTADVHIIYLPQGLRLPTMAKSYSAST